VVTSDEYNSGAASGQGNLTGVRIRGFGNPGC